MATLTWIGGGDNEASNPKDWSPTGLPEPGDNLTMTAGTMNVAGYDLFPNTTLDVIGDVTINLSRDASFDTQVFDGDPVINISGIDTLVLSSEHVAAPIINLANNAEWIGNFAVYYNSASVTVNGPSSATFINTAEPNMTNSGPSGISGTMTINVKVSGNGIFNDDTFGTMTFEKAVGAGQTVNMIAVSGTQLNGQPYPVPILKLDDPKQFAGVVNLSSGEIDLIGLAKADSYSFKNDILSIFDGKRVIDRLSLQATAGSLGVEKTAVGVSIYTANDTSRPAGTLLPLHT